MPNWWEQDETVEAGQPAGNWWDQDQAVEKPEAKKRRDGRWWDKDETVEAKAAGPLSATGQAHDGDTFRLNTGQNGRLYGYDAFELDQQGMQGGRLVPLGQQSRDALIPFLRPDTTVTPTGKSTYGRPVVSLSEDGADAGKAMLDQGMGLATPSYLKGDSRLTDYMEAERLARLNRRGAHAGEFQDPADFRKGKPDPWAKPEWQDSPTPGSVAVFNDEPTPFQGLRPEVAKGYQRIWMDPASKPDDLLAYAKENGFLIDPETTRKAYAERAKRGADPTINYIDPPKLLTNPGDGALGAGVRGLSDPINMLDEAGGVVDTLGLTDGRENIWSSDRRFADILANNIDQNRSILGYDDANHPYARFGGQLASGIVIPGASVEGVGLAAARQVLRAGGTRYAAEQAAKQAVRRASAGAGAVEGGLAGFGQGEGGVVDRLPGAGIGAVTGGALGYGTAALAQEVGPYARQAIEQMRGRRVAETVAETAGEQAPGVGVDQTLKGMPQQGARGAGIAADGISTSPSIASLRAERDAIVNQHFDARRRGYGRAESDYVEARMQSIAEHDGMARLGADNPANDDPLADAALDAADAAYARQQSDMRDAFAKEFRQNNPIDTSLSPEVVARLGRVPARGVGFEGSEADRTRAHR